MSRLKWLFCKAWLLGWVDDLRFHALFDNISVTSGRLLDDNEISMIFRSLEGKNYIKEMKIGNSMLSLFTTSNEICNTSHAPSTGLSGTLFSLTN